MKLISCHISGYGSLRDKDIKFDGGLTQICEPNGYGKTTLASFIKAMFYGLPSYRAGSEEKSERAHYVRERRRGVPHRAHVRRKER